MAIVLAEHYPHTTSMNMLRVLKMALIHDLAEIYAGDTYCYDETMSQSQAEREFLAADKIFSLLPTDIRHIVFLWLAIRN